MAAYCSRQCQASHRKSHKPFCRPRPLPEEWGGGGTSSPPSHPVVFRGLADKVALKVERLEGAVEWLGTSSSPPPLQVREYGEGHVSRPHQWSSLGYVPTVTYSLPVDFARRISSGQAAASDAYVASCDVSSSSSVVASLTSVFDSLMSNLHLSLSPHFKNQINLWWGAPGHHEGLHLDITHGTLIQLAGRKRVGLFPPTVWASDLYPFPVDESGKTSWAFSQTSGELSLINLAKFPRLRHAMQVKQEVLLNPGDVLFIPCGWSHEVTGEDDGSSPHVLSVNRFYYTPMTELTFLPDDVKQHFRQKLGLKL